MRRRCALVLAAGLAVAACASPMPTRPPKPWTWTPPSPRFAVDQGLGVHLDPTLGNPGYDVRHYDLALRYEPSSSALDATVTITAVATTGLDAVNVDFVGFDVHEVTVDGRKAIFDRTSRDMTVRAPAPIASGATFELRVRYRGVPAADFSPGGVAPLGWRSKESMKGFAFSRGTTSYVFAEPTGARRWFPCNDVLTDTATYTFRIDVPDPFAAAANGVFEGARRSDGRTTWVWEMDDPMPTYLATVVVSEKARVVDDVDGSRVAGVPIRNFLDPSGPPVPALERQGDMLTFLAGTFGPYPFDAYGVAFVPDLHGAEECSTLTLVGIPAETVLVHEMAHAWVGDSVTLPRWEDVWLKEGLATYAEWLWAVHTSERSLDSLAREAYGVVSQTGAAMPDKPGDPRLDDLYGPSTYQRGALTVYALRLRIGDEATARLLRTWTTRYAGRAPTTEDFIALAEEVSGADLTSLFDGWLYQFSMPAFPGPPDPGARPSGYN